MILPNLSQLSLSSSLAFVILALSCQNSHLAFSLGYHLCFLLPLQLRLCPWPVFLTPLFPLPWILAFSCLFGVCFYSWSERFYGTFSFVLRAFNSYLCRRQQGLFVLCHVPSGPMVLGTFFFSIPIYLRDNNTLPHHDGSLS